MWTPSEQEHEGNKSRAEETAVCTVVTSLPCWPEFNPQHPGSKEPVLVIPVRGGVQGQISGISADHSRGGDRQTLGLPGQST